jgi:kinesin family protein C2/C3
LDRVVGPDIGQAGMFEEVEHVVASVVDGYRCCIFAYGITGGGKTYTMQGPPSGTIGPRPVCIIYRRCPHVTARPCVSMVPIRSADPGVNSRMLEKIFKLCSARSDTHVFTVTLSMLEIYNEEVGDCPPTQHSL